MTNSSKPSRNRTLTLSPGEEQRLRPRIGQAQSELPIDACDGRVFFGSVPEVLDFFPDHFVDLLILDPPYNLDKRFGEVAFHQKSMQEYAQYLDNILRRLLRLLRPTASIYLCGDWKCSPAGYEVLSRYFQVRNRITWEREKGRGAMSNWKNCSEDILFATVGTHYTFCADAVRLRRRVIAPYRTAEGAPKDWTQGESGKFRDTMPSNFWSDLTIPYWSMPENTAHPTQKPEKLLAKLILASSRPGEMVFDPFLGSGTTAVVARKLNRRFCGIDCNEEYLLWALRRLELAERFPRIQGYDNGIFYERNTFAEQRRKSSPELSESMASDA
ncbi:MAG: DNA methyltransferase [Victivallaceae bacterium]|nr:DNA methyltransferase [Victivallaceae bacterium]